MPLHFRRPRWPVLLACALNVLILLALIFLYRPMYPIKPGTSDEFWSVNIQIAPRGPASTPKGYGFIKDGIAYYTPFTMDQQVYSVPEDEVAKDLPLVLRQLDAKVANPAADDDVARAYRFWKALPPYNADGINGLCRAVIDARISRQIQEPWHYPGVARGFLSGPNETHMQVERSRFYWANAAFETLFFSALIWFLLWPAVRRLKTHFWLLHLFLAPFLFFLPAWLGYGAAFYVDAARPTGGILYPHLIAFLQHHACIANPDWEIAFLKTLPKLLQPINQSPWDLEEALDLKEIFYYFTGPLEAAAGSVLLCLPLVLKKLATRVRRYLPHRHSVRGFEVITSDSTPAE